MVELYLINKTSKKRYRKLNKILLLLEKDGRMSLTKIAKEIKLPISTTFEYMKEIKEDYKFTVERRK